MLAYRASRCLRSFSGTESSYIEICRFIRSSLRCPSQSHSVSGCLLRARRGFHEDGTAPKTPSFLDTYKTSLSFPSATHHLPKLSRDVISEEVILHGYIGQQSHLSKKFCFVPLLSGTLNWKIQIVSFAESSDGTPNPVHGELRNLTPHTPVAIRGILKSRDTPDASRKMLTSPDVPSPKRDHDIHTIKEIKDMEVEVSSIHVLNEFPKDIITGEEVLFPPEQRHLQLRFDNTLKKAIIFRSKIASRCRNMLREWRFVEVETPLLFKSTSEGAREFVVPTRRKGLAYALPQSPQQFKQILMASGIFRYFQIARCFRDEDLRADRQPEFTQLDLEMAFASSEDVMDCVESLITDLWNLLKHKLPKFPRMTYTEAMTLYGSDKPDTRLGKPFHKVGHLLPVDLISKITSLESPIVEALLLRPESPTVTPTKTRKLVGRFLSSPEGAPFRNNPDGGPGVFVYDSTKPLSGLQAFGFEAAEEIERIFDPVDGDLILLQARKDEPFSGGSTPLGNLRVALHREAVKNSLTQPPNGFAPLWITDFPLFSPTSDTEPGQGGSAGLASTHHPFTSPKTAEDVDLLLTDPSKVIGDHYDVVMNGVELGGGSRRIHNAEMQRFIMKDVLKMSDKRIEDFSHLLEALRAGCPPHAGIALGFDRLVAVMLGRESVRDVIAFPKSGKGEDLMVNSPGVLTEEELKTYHLKLV